MMATEGLNSHLEQESYSRKALFDGDAAAFLVSLLFHLCLLVGLGLAPVFFEQERVSLTIVTPAQEVVEEEELMPPEEFFISDRPLPEIGANSVNDSDMALSAGEVLSDISEIPSPVDIRPGDFAPVETNQAIEVATALHLDRMPVRGAAGEGTQGATGAVDRITQDILLSLEERPTLVVWLFDQSASLLRQRKEIHARFDRVYEELGVIEAAENPAFEKHSSKPLLTSVVAFGANVTFVTDQPTDDLDEIKKAVASIPLDDTGIERVFTAAYMSADRFKRYRRNRPIRNVMLIVFTDEAGEDQTGVDRCVNLCRRFEMPVYVVGVPAPFGRRETLVKWVDPDPNYDQSPQWGVVDQGPETLVPERVKLAFFGGADPDPMDSGFGPFALTRLCYETGGIYFTVHPNRNVNRHVRRGETAAFSAHLKHFFDPEVMRTYRPDYVSTQEYMRRIQKNVARTALVKAAQMSWVGQMATPATRFVKANDAELARNLTEAQKAAAVLEPRIGALYETLLLGVEDRDREFSLRWQAAYDLALGRVLSAKVRTEGYNAMLAQAKRGIKFTKAKNNTWVLRPAKEISVGSRMAKEAERATELLEQVKRDHTGTPWALLAARELSTPLGWKWEESFTDLSPPPRNRSAKNNNNAGARNDRARRIPTPPPKRPPPKL
jgi:hypothetical protein